MSQRRKLIERFRDPPMEADFHEVRQLLEYFGWTLQREGKHASFTKQGEFPIVIPKVGGRKVKRTYLRQIRDRLKLDEWES